MKVGSPKQNCEKKFRKEDPVKGSSGEKNGMKRKRRKEHTRLLKERGGHLGKKKRTNWEVTRLWRVSESIWNSLKESKGVFKDERGYIEGESCDCNGGSIEEA